MTKDPKGQKNAHGVSRRNVLAASALTAAASTMSLGAIGTARAQNEDPLYDIVIVGAGLAGLTAARDLKKAGVNSFKVLEARNRVGGRTLNQDLGRGAIADAGGQWIGPTQFAILELARELGVATHPTFNDGKIAVLINGDATSVDGSNSIVTNVDFINAVDKLANDIPVNTPWSASQASEFDSITFREWIVTQALSEEDLVALEASTALTFGAPPDAISFLHILQASKSAGGFSALEAIKGGAQQDRLVGGAQSLSLKMYEELRDHVQLETPVTRILDWESSSDACQLITEKGVIRANQVIMALSPSLCNQIAFDSPLPPKRADLHRTWPVVSSGIKAQMRYREPFWRAKGFSGQSFSDSGPYIWSIDNSPADDSSGVLLCFLDQDVAPRDKESRKLQIAETYVTCFGEEAAAPLSYVEKSWDDDPWTKGCVSPLAPGQLSTLGEALRPSLGRLHWSGTETSAFWTGYMDGAVRSGHAAALKAMGALSAPPPVPG